MVLVLHETGCKRVPVNLHADAMRALIFLVVTALLAGTAVASTTTSDATTQELAGELAQVIEGPGWADDSWSVLAVSLDNGDTLFAHNPGAELAPASNLKLFTTAAALHFLGPDHRYSTYVTSRGTLRNGVLEGDLLLYGTGDPTISGRFYEAESAVLESLADSLVALGVRRIAGDVLGDGSYFEGSGVGQGWQSTYITHTYAAPSGALNFNDNVVTLHVKPAPASGAPPVVDILPAGNVPYRNEAQTVASGRTHIEVERESYEAPLVLTGQITTGSSPVWRAVPVPDPAVFAASAFAEALVEAGITVDGEVRSVHQAERSPVTGRRVFAPAFDDQPAVQVLALHRSPPLQEILGVINQRSHNLYADAVLRTVGRVATGHGSIAGGAAAVQSLLGEDSPEAAALRMEDGSGLSTLNRASAGAIVELLAFMDSSEFRDAYFETLPEAAVSRGLRRMQETPAAGNLRAKTGTIERVSALSGYVTAQNGERLAFAIISNNVPSTWRAKRIEDRIGARLAAVDRAAPPTRRLASTAAEPSGREAGSVPEEQQESGSGDDAATPSATSTYVVKGGDTLEGIARQHGITLNDLQEANPGLDPRRLMPGQELELPAGD